MSHFEVGDRVRIDIPDTEDIDFELHGNHGEVVMVFEDDAGEVTGAEANSIIYRVDVDDYERSSNSQRPRQRSDVKSNGKIEYNNCWNVDTGKYLTFE